VVGVGAAACGMIAIALLSAAGPRDIKAGAAQAPATFANVEEIVLHACSMCHSAEPVWASIVTAPKGILLDDFSAYQAQCPADRAQRGVGECDAAGQRHRNDRRRAGGDQGVAVGRRAAVDDATSLRRIGACRFGRPRRLFQPCLPV